MTAGANQTATRDQPMAGVVVEDSSVTVFFYLGLALLFGWMLVIIILVRHHWLEWVMGCCCWKRRPASISTSLSRDGSLHERVSRTGSGASEGRPRSTSRTSRKSHRAVSEKQSTGQQSLGSRRSRKDAGGEEEKAPLPPPPARPPSPPTHAVVCLSSTYQTPV